MLKPGTYNLLRRTALVLSLAALPAGAYLVCQGVVNGARDRALLRARADQTAWQTFLAESAADAYGYKVGMVFPRLPFAPPNSHRILGNSRRTVVMLRGSIPTRPNTNELNDWRRIVDENPDLNLLVVTDESEQQIAANAVHLKHPRIQYSRVVQGYLEKLSARGTPALYYVDSAGIIRNRVFVQYSTPLREITARWITKASG